MSDFLFHLTPCRQVWVFVQKIESQRLVTQTHNQSQRSEIVMPEIKMFYKSLHLFPSCSVWSQMVSRAY